MKIVCYINKLNDGGAERVMSVLANGLDRLGHKVFLVTDYSVANEYPVNSSIVRMILDGAFTGVSRKGRIKRTLKRIQSLYEICKKEKIDIVISFMRDANFRAILATCFLKTKNLISVRVDPKIGYKNRSTAILAKMLYPFADGCVFQTQEAQDWFPAKVQRRSRIILNPVADSFFQVQGVPMQEKRIVSCGRLDKQKRFDLLIDAFDKICDLFPEYSLEIYGTGELKETLNEQIRMYKRENRIFLMGRCEDVPNAIKNASLFVLTSDFEGLPNALMEAMVLGLPVISTDCGGGGARTLIDDGDNGLIVPCGDVAALAEAIRLSLTDPYSMIIQGKRAQEMGQSFAAKNITMAWERYIRDICGKCGI